MSTCKHKNYAYAGHLYEHPGGQKDIRVQTIYKVFCLDCKHFVNLLTGEFIDDEGLTSPIHLDPELCEKYGISKEDIN